MKKLILILFLIPLFVHAQFPTAVKTAPKGLDWLFDNEGDYFRYFNFSAYSPAQPTVKPATTALTNVFSGTIQIDAGFVARFNSLKFNTDGPGFLTYNINRTSANTTLGRISQTENVPFGTNGGTYEIFGLDLYDSGFLSYGFFATTTLNPNVSISGLAKMISSDINPNARYSFLQIGDSQVYTALGTVGGLGVTGNAGNTMHGRRIVDSLKKLGFDIRLINKGVSGITTAQYLPRIISGELDAMIKSSGMIELHLGTNDAALGTAASQNFQAGMIAMVNHIKSVNPNTSLFITSPPQSDKPPIPTNIGGYKTIMAALAALYPTMHIYYVDNTITTASTSYYTETVAGTLLHLRGDTGELVWANQLMGVIPATYFYTNPNQSSN